MSNSSQDNTQKGNDQARRPNEGGQQNQGGQEKQAGQQNQGGQRKQPDQQSQGHPESGKIGTGQQAGGSKEGSK